MKIKLIVFILFACTIHAILSNNSDSISTKTLLKNLKTTKPAIKLVPVKYKVPVKSKVTPKRKPKKVVSKTTVAKKQLVQPSSVTTTQPCPGGKIFNLNTKTCDCPLGKFLINDVCCSRLQTSQGSLKCTDCPDGKIFDGVQCNSCPPGQITTDNITCMACPIGQITTDAKSCSPCVFSGQFTTDNVTCNTCPQGQISDGKSCTACPAGQITTDGARCNSCPPGQITTDGVTCKCPEGSKLLPDGSCCPNDHVWLDELDQYGFPTGEGRFDITGYGCNML